MTPDEVSFKEMLQSRNQEYDLLAATGKVILDSYTAQLRSFGIKFKSLDEQTQGYVLFGSMVATSLTVSSDTKSGYLSSVLFLAGGKDLSNGKLLAETPFNVKGLIDQDGNVYLKHLREVVDGITNSENRVLLTVKKDPIDLTGYVLR